MAVPTHESTAKRLRQSEKRRQHNRISRSRIRTLTKQIRLEPGADEAPELLKEVSILLDRYAGRNLHHRNKANRLKSNLTRLINAARQT
jgi:small subunit ribosomal protein S20